MHTEQRSDGMGDARHRAAREAATRRVKLLDDSHALFLDGRDFNGGVKRDFTVENILLARANLVRQAMDEALRFEYPVGWTKPENR